MQNFWFNPGIPQPSSGNFMTAVAVLISPTSRASCLLALGAHKRLTNYIAYTGGSIKIASTNPFDKPLIDPKYLTTEFDIFTMREAVKAIKRFLAAPAFSSHVSGPFGTSFSGATDDASIESYVRGLTTTIFHPVGTASMSSQTAKTGVVNPDLTVKGTVGLRIVDASVFVSLSLEPNIRD